MDITFLPELAFAFIMVFARLAAIFTLMPALGAQTVPLRIRLTIALALTIILVPLVGDSVPAMPPSVFGTFFALVSEMIIGLFIGMTVMIITSALQTAGASIAFQTSLSAAQNADIASAVQGTLIANFLSVVSLTLIFVMNLHHMMIAAMFDSYELFPPGQLMPIGDIAESAVDAFAGAFLLGVQLSAPFIVVGLVFNMGVGILSRLMPQLQVLLVLLPVNIMIGFFVLFALIGTIMMWYVDHLRDGLAIFIAN